MKTFITQPTYLPWIGIFKAIQYSDIFVFYDDVQFERKSWQNRNKIFNKSAGKEMYITVPVKNSSQKTQINKIEIQDKNFFLDHIKKIENNYKKTKFRDDLIKVVEVVYKKNFSKLADLNIELIKGLSEFLGIRKKFILSSDLCINGDKYIRPFLIAKRLKTTEYLTQVGTKDYLDESNFVRHGIKVKYLDFKHPVYNQFNKDFVPYLSIVDVLSNIGPQKTARLIKEIQI